MMCPDREAELNEYVDGTLGPAARQAVERHLAECPGCRDAAAELRRLVVQARGLPSSVEPGRDLWGGVAARIRGLEAGPGRRWWRERAFWMGALAAAAVFVIALGVYRVTAPAPDRSAEQRWVAVQADYERAARDLSTALAAQRERLAPETAALVERNLRIIDAAIADSRAALAGDPGNAELRRLFAAAYWEKVELLRWAARVAAS